MKAPVLVLLLAAVAVVFLSGCSTCSTCNKGGGATGGGNTSDPVALCIGLCQSVKANDTDLANGPCLSDEIVQDWVCDVAHNPREAVDNDPANQCPAFGNTSHHFVEVDENCSAIKQY
jgi:hypothetical protein